MTIAGIIFDPVWTNLYCSAVPSMFCNTQRIVYYPNDSRQEININAAGIFIFLSRYVEIFCYCCSSSSSWSSNLPKRKGNSTKNLTLLKVNYIVIFKREVVGRHIAP